MSGIALARLGPPELVQELYCTVVLIYVYNTPPQEKVRQSAKIVNSHLRLYLLFYKTVSDRFEKKLKLLFHI